MKEEKRLVDRNAWSRGVAAVTSRRTFLSTAVLGAGIAGLSAKAGSEEKKNGADVDDQKERNFTVNPPECTRTWNLMGSRTFRDLFSLPGLGGLPLHTILDIVKPTGDAVWNTWGVPFMTALQNTGLTLYDLYTRDIDTWDIAAGKPVKNAALNIHNNKAYVLPFVTLNANKRDEIEKLFSGYFTIKEGPSAGRTIRTQTFGQSFKNEAGNHLSLDGYAGPYKPDKWQEKLFDRAFDLDILGFIALSRPILGGADLEKNHCLYKDFNGAWQCFDDGVENHRCHVTAGVPDGGCSVCN